MNSCFNGVAADLMVTFNKKLDGACLLLRSRLFRLLDFLFSLLIDSRRLENLKCYTRVLCKHTHTYEEREIIVHVLAGMCAGAGSSRLCGSTLTRSAVGVGPD